VTVLCQLNCAISKVSAQHGLRCSPGLTGLALFGVPFFIAEGPARDVGARIGLALHEYVLVLTH